MKLCEQCGTAEIPSTSKRSHRRFCAECLAARDRANRHARRRRQRRLRAAEPHPRFTGRKRRTCLTCGKEFSSAWAGNRRCPHCKEDPLWRDCSWRMPMRLWLPSGEAPDNE